MVLPRGEAIRNFILSGTAERIRKHHKLSVISVFPNKEIEQLLRDNCDQLFELTPERPPYELRILRDFIDIVHGRVLWSGAAQLRWKLRDSEAKSLKLKLFRLFKKNAALLFANEKSLSQLSKREERLSQGKYVSKKYKALLETLRVDHVFNGSHIHSKDALPIMHAAKSLGLPISTFLFSWDNLTSQGRIMPMYDYYLSWNEDIKRDLLKIYPSIQADQVFVPGTPQFDFHFDKDALMERAEFCKLMGLSDKRPILLYTTGMMNLQPFEELIVERLMIHLRDNYAEENRPQLLVRVYPKDKTPRYEKLKQLNFEGVVFPKIEWEQKFLTPLPKDLKLWSNMLHHCALGINQASTVALELAMFDKPIIGVGFDPPGVDISPINFADLYKFDHYVPIVNTGALDIAFSEEELYKYIDQNLKAPEAKRVERAQLIRQFFNPQLDGNARERVADVLSSLTER